MKNKHLQHGLTILSFFISHSAFASHAYRTQSCKSDTLEFQYLGNYPVGGDYAISRPTSKDKIRFKAFVKGDESGNDSDADVIVSLKETKRGPSEKSSDCGFDYESWDSKYDFKFVWATKQASKKLGIKKGDVISFECDEELDTPNGKDHDPDCKDSN